MINSNELKPKSYLHDYKFHSIMYGEPFLYDKILWYFDGKNARIVGYDVEAKPITDGKFSRIIAFILNNHNPKTISIESPRLVSEKKNLINYKRSILARPGKYDYEFFVNKENYDETDYIKSDIRKALNKGLVCKVYDGKSLIPSYKHIELLKDFLNSIEFSPYYQVEFITATLSSLMSPETTLVEARKGGELRGYGIVRKYDSIAIFNILFVLSSEKSGVSDVIYKTLIDYFFQSGVNCISLGNSPTKGLYKYKQKWGKPKLKGTYELLWLDIRRKRIPSYLWLTEIINKIIE